MKRLFLDTNIVVDVYLVIVTVTTQIESNGRRSSMGAEVPDPSAPVICQ